MMREKTCCFTGHRVIPADQKGYLESALRQTIDNLIGRGFRFSALGERWDSILWRLRLFCHGKLFIPISA